MKLKLKSKLDFPLSSHLTSFKFSKIIQCLADDISSIWCMIIFWFCRKVSVTDGHENMLDTYNIYLYILWYETVPVWNIYWEL